MRIKATMRKREAMFATVDGDKFEGSEYATAMVVDVVEYSDDVSEL